LSFFSLSCGVSYPSGSIADSLEEIVKKDTGTDSEALVYGKTLYLDMLLNDLTSNDTAKVNAAISKMQSAILAITRVVLSSDSKIKYMVVSTFDKDKQVLFRITQNIEDIKAYLYMKISRGDYETRNLLEIEGPGYAAKEIDDKHDISDEEYVARMIVAQINMQARTNPFLGALVQLLQLRFLRIDGENIILSGSGEMDEKVKDFITKMISDEANKYCVKYSVNFKSINIFGAKGEPVASITL
jgi:hypothetical protein